MGLEINNIAIKHGTEKLLWIIRTTEKTIIRVLISPLFPQQLTQVIRADMVSWFYCQLWCVTGRLPHHCPFLFCPLFCLFCHSFVVLSESIISVIVYWLLKCETKKIMLHFNYFKVTGRTNPKLYTPLCKASIISGEKRHFGLFLWGIKTLQEVLFSIWFPAETITKAGISGV